MPSHRVNKKYTRILKMIQKQSFKEKNIKFWGDVKDIEEWQKDVIQCFPVDEIVPYGKSENGHGAVV